ncbi:ribonuclease domain-containing protein [Rahnella aquatilis]|uniref:Ribonuclease n=1 Tax=Rahnella aquatilis (strain ATCC 33071 / DSM 4594 / JCM 1683 / NBRC 105701 / NCIMB 13365 / CIP 78.65) TaxID=745277 RepID=H2IU90_RAHAC|nr:ribonuclease domain-containing protein [Rahnella aquatilis]AEX53872.1 guanyl-specific ribonuclease Sa [Rahnella aquatilis CIP 78.65 = ATCC 33071]KFD02677.1 putative ribonuclease [Rahnella aquatilis CIP 78.65 = ATCC 33071]
MKAFNGRRARNLMMAAAVIFGLCGVAGQGVAKTTYNQGTIVAGTDEQTVIGYLRQNHKLPENYLTKKQAREAGWDARSGNLCDVLPGKAIGGDRFSNREGRLPSAYKRVWREADINYRCGRRGADRVLFASDGLIYVSKDHYQNFVRVE